MQEQEEDEEELYEHHRIMVDKGQFLMRVDKYLMIKLPHVTRNKIQNGIDAKAIKVNEQPTKASYKAKPFDIITVSLPHPPREGGVIPQDLPINIVYEDEDLLIVNKAPDMVVHPALGHWDGTLVNGLVYHFQSLPTHRNGEIRPGLVHRIDKETSGLLVIAKTDYAMTHLAKQFAAHTIERTYVAVVWGEPKEEIGRIEGHIDRSLKDRKVRTVYLDGSRGKHAVTHYKVLQNFRYVSVVQCNLETGRTHQIRVHMRHLGHPLFNDSTYGGDKIVKGTVFAKYEQFVRNCFELCPRQALHAKSLGFIHPTTEKFVQFDSELPADMQAMINKWENYVQHN